MIQKQFQVLLDKPMDRREFLACLGKGVLIFTGVSALIKGMIGFTDQSHKTRSTSYAPHLNATHGFGSSRFGT